ncbi:hypothetical protein C3O85_19315, partial [Clostridioides difficile]
PESARWINAKRIKEKYKKNKLYIEGMFSKAHIKNTLLYSFIWFLYDIGAYGIGLLIPLIFKKSGFISNEENALITSSILLTGIASSAVGLLNIDRIGRKNIQLAGFAGMGISLFLIPYFYGTLAGLTAVIFIAEIFNSLASLTVGIFPAELSHTSFRSSAYGFSATAGKIGAVCGVLIMTYFVGNNKDLGYYAVAGLISAAFFLSFFLPETGNKRLDEIK